MRRGTFRAETPVTLKCDWCGKPMVVGREHAKTCSPKCRKAASRHAAANKGNSPAPPPAAARSPAEHKRKENRSAGHPWDAILTKGKADSGLAMEILGIKPPVTKATAQAAYKRLCMENHPDRGGSTQMMQWLNAAWSYLKNFHAWK